MFEVTDLCYARRSLVKMVSISDSSFEDCIFFCMSVTRFVAFRLFLIWSSPTSQHPIKNQLASHSKTLQLPAWSRALSHFAGSRVHPSWVCSTFVAIADFSAVHARQLPFLYIYRTPRLFKHMHLLSDSKYQLRSMRLMNNMHLITRVSGITCFPQCASDRVTHPVWICR